MSTMTENKPTHKQPSAADQRQTPMTSFIDLLPELDGGVFLEKINRAMSDVPIGAVSVGRKGKLTLEFEFVQIGESTQVNLKHTIKYVIPRKNGESTEKNASATPLHVGPRGRLTLFPEPAPLFPQSRD